MTDCAAFIILPLADGLCRMDCFVHLPAAASSVWYDWC